MIKIKIAIILLSIIACSKIHDKTEQRNLDPLANAQWIEEVRDLPVNDSLFYLDNPSPLFRKEFKTDKTIENATLFITAAGYYHASINGARIGKNVLDPAWTDFSKRIYYTEYDLTSLIHQGDNCLGVSLGNGFYNPLPLRKWGRRNLRADINVGKPTFIAKLLINYKNGTSEEIITDTSWKHADGPLTKNSVYLGVAYDARKEIEGWNNPGFNDTTWKEVKMGAGPGGKLEKAFFPPVQVTQNIKPKEVSSPNKGVYIVDMGVNFTGTYKIKLGGNKGDTISFRFGERLYEDGTLNPMTTVIGQIKKKGIGGPGAPDVAWQSDSYIIGESSESWFQPEFTYHTYRYMEIKGLEEAPEISNIEGLFMNSNVANKSSFSSSSDLLNSIQDITERTFLSNLISVQSDCPAREKFGYGGDLNATSESFIYNFDMQGFYRKTINDWVDAMRDSTFVDTAPYAGVAYCGISWESAYLTTQYNLYLYYKDTEIVKEFYVRNKLWMDKAARLHPKGMVESGLSDHESLEPVPVELTGTTHYLQCARIMATFASVMGDADNQKKYQALADNLKKQVKAKFWDQAVKEKINRQTLFSALIYHGIVPDSEIEAAKDSLLLAVKNGPAGHFNTGIFGTKYVLESLSKTGSADLVFDIVNSTTYPGWGHMIDNGATTIWETWKESDNVYSNNHPMFGTVTEWYYRWLGGIRPDPESPGFKTFVLGPTVPEGLEFVNCSYQTPFGTIVSNWEKKEDGSIHYEMKIPSGTEANIILPLNASQSISIENEEIDFDSEKIEGLQTGNFKLREGDYSITVSSIN